MVPGSQIVAKLWLYLPFFTFYGFLKRCVHRDKQVKPYFGSQQPRPCWGELTSYRVIRQKGAYAVRCVGFTDELLKCSTTDQRPKTASLQSTVTSTLSSVLAPWLPSKPALVFSWPTTTYFVDVYSKRPHYIRERPKLEREMEETSWSSV